MLNPGMRRTTWFSVLTALVLSGGRSFAQEWVAFDPGASALVADSVINLRRLNEAQAGEHGPIAAMDGRFIRTGDGKPVRFWGVNGPPSSADSPEKLRAVARSLASRGVNLVRLHGAVFDKNGDVDRAKVRRLRETVEALKAEGIYSLFSIYFPLWLDPKPDSTWLRGYDGKTHAFAALMFNPEFQARYHEWWEALLESKDSTGLRLIEDPAVMGLEVQNEDSFFFWTFSEKNIPAPQLERLESQFGAWAGKKHGSIAQALATWGSPPLARDRPAEGRLAFRPLWNVANERTARDRDTAAFLFEKQSGFYRDTVTYLRGRGFHGVITASNWTTADARVLGPLEKMSYLEGDFIDRHGYFSGSVKGEASEWSIRAGHIYSDRSALKFESEKPGGPRTFVHPAMDPEYNGFPSMISETTWTRPNRHRGEAPLFYAAYGALQESDAIVHFALDGAEWSVKPGYFMQPWTLMAPTQMGQFPATALLYREGLVKPGIVLAEVRLKRQDVLDLKGTPLPQDAAFDELRLKDVPDGSGPVRDGQRLDPLLHLAGRSRVTFGNGPSGVDLRPLTGLIDRTAKRVTSSTGELDLDYGKGLLQVKAPAAQGASGDFAAHGPVALPDLRIISDLDVLTVLAVSLDGKPLRESASILLQVMTEESTTGWATEPAGPGLKKITQLGTNPWRIRAVQGTVEFLRSDAAKLRVTPLDLQGHPQASAGDGVKIQLQPGTVYYQIAR